MCKANCQRRPANTLGTPCSVYVGNGAIMKIITLAILALAQSSALAAGLPDPMTCGQKFSGEQHIQHHGQTFIAAGETYDLNLKFGKGSVFSYNSNWRVDVDNETVDGTKLKNTWNVGLLQHLAFNTNGNLDCAIGHLTDRCALSLYDVLQKINVASQNIIESPESADQLTALDCARSIILSFAARIFENKDFARSRTAADFFKLQTLTQDQAANVLTRMNALHAAQEAQQASINAQINANTANLNAILSQSRR
jgi:hypothetical protein